MSPSCRAPRFSFLFWGGVPAPASECAIVFNVRAFLSLSYQVFHVSGYFVLFVYRAPRFAGGVRA